MRIGHAHQLRSGVSSQTVKLLTNSDQPPCDPPQRTLDGVAVSIRTFSADPWSGDLPDIADCRQLCGRLALVAKTARQIAETSRTDGDMMRSLESLCVKIAGELDFSFFAKNQAEATARADLDPGGRVRRRQ